jgi:hypothetical protein
MRQSRIKSIRDSFRVIETALLASSGKFPEGYSPYFLPQLAEEGKSKGTSQPTNLKSFKTVTMSNLGGVAPLFSRSHKMTEYKMLLTLTS